MIKFPSLYAFIEEYIIPLTRKFSCTKTLDLSCLVGDDDMFRKGFESSYESIFVKGCHIPRIPRAAGITTIPETKHRIMYRHLIKDLWEILGSLFFFMPTCFVYNFLIIRFRRRWFWYLFRWRTCSACKWFWSIWNSNTIRRAFLCFFLKGISRISADAVELNIMRESAISKNYKVACTNFCLLFNIMWDILSDLDLITLYIYYFYPLCTLLIT